MQRNRVLAAFVMAAGSLALAASTDGSASFNLPLTPGHYTSSSSFAYAGMPDSAGDSTSIVISYGQLRFRPRGGNGPLLQVNGTAVNVSVGMADGLFGSGCWLLNGDALPVSSGLTAGMTFDSSAAGVSPCPGLLVNQSAIVAVPHLSNLDQPQGLSGPLRFSVQWTPDQPLDTLHSVLNGTCQSWTSLERITSTNAFASATATLSATVSGVNFSTGNSETESVDASFSTNPGGVAQVTTGTDDEVVNGPAAGNCGPYGQ